jgi:ubiquinone/menaquinone biosynthesis C-methylase UbiE
MRMSEAANLFTDGKAYERLMGRWSRVAGEIFLDWIDPPKNLRWLDVGCGNGAFTEALIARCSPAAVTGVDPSDGQLDYARTRPGTKTAQFRIADAQELPFADDSFDAASMALVIAFLPDPLKAAAEMARVVRPGGTIATYMWDFHGGGFPLAPIATAMKSLGMSQPAPPYADASRRETMRTIWQQAGLQSIDTRVIRIAIVYSGFDDFWDSNSAPVGTSGKAIADLSPSARDELKARLREQLPTGSDGRITYEAFANAVKGRVP